MAQYSVLISGHFSGVLPVFWILHFIVVLELTEMSVKLQDNVLAENYHTLKMFL